MAREGIGVRRGAIPTLRALGVGEDARRRVDLAEFAWEGAAHVVASQMQLLHYREQAEFGGERAAERVHIEIAVTRGAQMKNASISGHAPSDFQNKRVDGSWQTRVGLRVLTTAG